MELVEKELAKENKNYTKYNNKNFDILQNTESSKKKEKKEMNKNEGGVQIIKIINKKIENNIRSRTPDNLVFKRFNKRKEAKNKKLFLMKIFLNQI